MTPYFVESRDNTFSEASDSLFNILAEQLDWVQVENVPRKEYWATTKGEPYTYGSGPGERTYQPQPLNFFVELIREFVFQETKVYFEGCFLNYYETGKDSLGWHADDDPGIDHDYPIVIVTLGNERELQWKLQGSKGQEAINTEVLTPGSLFVMPAGMQ